MDGRKRAWHPWLYLLAVTAAEVLAAAGDIWAGLLVHMAVLILLTVPASLAGGREHRFYLALMPAPLIRLLSLVLPVVFLGLLFAAMHITHLSWPDVVFVFFVGLFFTWAVFRTGSLSGVTLAHGLNNVLPYLVLPFLNPLTLGNPGKTARSSPGDFFCAPTIRREAGTAFHQ